MSKNLTIETVIETVNQATEVIMPTLETILLMGGGYKC